MKAKCSVTVGERKAANPRMEEEARIMSLLGEKNHLISIRGNLEKHLGGKEGLWEELGHCLGKRKACFAEEHQGESDDRERTSLLKGRLSLKTLSSGWASSFLGLKVSHVYMLLTPSGLPCLCN